MIPLTLPATSDAEEAFVTRLRRAPRSTDPTLESVLIDEDAQGAIFSGVTGLISIDGATADSLDGDVVLMQPGAQRIERLIRADSPHNTLLVTERCDQLCVMCSQPPRKTHHDRFDLLEKSCLLADAGVLIGISGGEPTLYKERLLTMLERVLSRRPDLQFHVLSNAQHFDAADVERLRSPLYRNVSWGIPLYAAEPVLHDQIVGKIGAFEQLEQGFAHLMMAGARVELRTVLLQSNLEALPGLARYVTARLRFIEAWSIMQLEHIGFAKGRWSELYVDHRGQFELVGGALDHAAMHGLSAQLFNFPRCSVPPAYRQYAIASISDWKRKYAPACVGCREKALCSGFFEWHPDEEAGRMVEPI
ncbi:MAG: His-Xaa-Ser system radical SAM maturase HxsC [Sphingomonas sp.]|jgi:His-Xaa-Ser system radical SAM maturase HxsC|uniref:His-Xaa-Ser system radical SAM maturase HxsC n=1 Tax=Sphingomonas sp. TaxID=28214 RepID=UPI00356A3846